MRTLSLYFILLSIIFSCKEDPYKNLSEKEKLLVSHGWHQSKIWINGVEGSTENPWEKDDCWVFHPDGTFTYSYGDLRSPTIHQTDLTQPWQLSGDESKLLYAMVEPLIEISSNLMILTFINETEIKEIYYIPC